MRNGRIEFFDELDALKDKVKRLRISAAEYWMGQSLGPVDWFLQGNHPVLASGIVVVSLISPWLVFRRLPRLYMAFAESAAGPPPMSLDLKALSKWNQDAATASRKSKWAWLKVKSISRLDQELTRKKPHDMSWLWIAGNETNDFELVCGMLRLGLITVIMFYVLYGRVLIGADSRSWLISGGTMAALFAIDGALLPGVSMIWRRRYAMLVDRSAFTKKSSLHAPREDSRARS